MSKNIMIIAQAIFPAKFPRSYRATELAKELARQGHNIIIYSVLGNYDYTDFQEYHNIKIKNIGKMCFAKLNSVDYGKITIIDKVLRRIFNRLIEFPDIELMFRVPRTLKKEKGIDLLISVAMPHTIHWGCAMARSFSPTNFPKVWAADCGDPYMGNKFFKKKPLFYFKYLENWFCNQTDFIVVPTQNIIPYYNTKYINKIRIIPQGFDFNIGNDIQYVKNSIPTFAFAGIFYPEKRDPSSFLDFLSKIKLPFRFILFTPELSLLKPYLSLLESKIEFRPYVSRDILINELKTMDFLININNKGNYGSPSKLIDYAISKRPILSFTSDSVPESTFMEFLQGDYTNQFIVKDIDQYRIENVAKSFLELLDD